MIQFPDGQAEWERVLNQFKEQTQKEHDEVVALGGLHIVGTERHDSRRIDNQLRGRAGRQGDPGSSRFYLSLQDDLLRIFGGERMQNLMLRLGMEEDVPIESNLITKRIAAAQKAVETQNFEMRKHLLEYDDVMNKQRKAIYSMRRSLLEGEDKKDRILEMASDLVGGYIDDRCIEGTNPSTWDLTGLMNDVLTEFGVKVNTEELIGLTREEIEAAITEQVNARYEEKESMVGPEIMRQTERWIMLQAIDDQWKDHLLSMDHLKEGIGLRGYGQKDPLVEYKKESYQLFQELMGRIEDETVRYLFFLRFERGDGTGGQAVTLPFPPPDEDYDEEDDEIEGQEAIRAEQERLARERQEAAARAAAQNTAQDLSRNIQRKKERELAELSMVGKDGDAKAKPVVKGNKVGRNELCPCGSGEKYKKCHGSATASKAV
jgi:preprotein translocase subunit SecA